MPDDNGRFGDVFRSVHNLTSLRTKLKARVRIALLTTNGVRKPVVTSNGVRKRVGVDRFVMSFARYHTLVAAFSCFWKKAPTEGRVFVVIISGNHFWPVR